MTKQLLIVESPSKAKTLKKYLGKGFEILASFGHVRDLVPKQGAVDTEHDFEMNYQLIPRNSKHVDAIAKAVANSDTILLATDPDREGEAIAWHIAEILKSKKLLKGKKAKRVVFYEITESAVRSAVEHPRDISMPLVNAQQARRALDYLVGFNLSPLLWRKVRPGLSAGRVQSPALRLIVERELEIEAFKSREYWTIHLESHKDKHSFNARLFQYQGKKLEQFSIENTADQEKIIANLQRASAPPKIVHVEKKKKQRQPAAPFSTSSMQQEAVRKLGMTTGNTMRTAQQLYEGMDVGSGVVGLITYMRTDSVNMANEAIAEIRSYIGKNYDADYLPKNPIIYKSKSKNAQEAHEAIRPTSIFRTPDSVRKYLSGEQAALYEMIWKRSLACQMNPAQFDTVSLDIMLGHEDTLFRANGQTLTFPGFIAVYQEGMDDSEEGEEKRLPVLELGETIPLDKLFGEQHFTQPPPRYTEASLVKALEEYGIGRPSTYASIISTLQDRKYALLDKKRFTPTDVGRIVNKFLTEHFTNYVDYDFTARLEDKLDHISNGDEEWVPVLKEFWQHFITLVEQKKNIPRKEVTQELMDENCPKCGKQLTIRLGKMGRFIGCSGFPDCDYTRSLDGTAQENTEPINLGIDPQTKLEIHLQKGPYGFYLELKGSEVGKNKKPKRVSWPANIPVASADLPTALQLLSLPIEIGAHPDTGKKIIANIGRFGPYVNHDGVFKSIPKTDNIFSIKLDRAVELLAQAKPGSRALRQLGAHPDDERLVAVYKGKYGPYVKYGKSNVTIPPELSAETITLEQALALLANKNKKGKKAKVEEVVETEKVKPKKSTAKVLEKKAKAKPVAKTKAAIKPKPKATVKKKKK
jgi:DNA topoisomerase-1